MEASRPLEASTLENFSSKIQYKARMPTLATSVQLSTKSLMRQEKGIKDTKLERKK